VFNKIDYACSLSSLSWKYQTKCTKRIHSSAANSQSSFQSASPPYSKMTSSAASSSSLESLSRSSRSSINESKSDSYSIVDDFNGSSISSSSSSSIKENVEQEDNRFKQFPSQQDLLVANAEFTTAATTSSTNIMRLKCLNADDFLFIGSTHYGVSKQSSNRFSGSCEPTLDDCIVSVDYIANECNGLNKCDIQLESQFLHTCKNYSDYLSVAYECIAGSKRVDVCSNDETFIIDSESVEGGEGDERDEAVLKRFGSFYMSSPNYPNEYDANMNNCSCRLDYVRLDAEGHDRDNSDSVNMNLVIKAYEFDVEEGEQLNKQSNVLKENICTKDKLIVSSSERTFNLCGQHKDFKEFYTNGKSVILNFTSDDVIARRGFLIKLSATTGI
jgi:hypothetical protein